MWHIKWKIANEQIRKQTKLIDTDNSAYQSEGWLGAGVVKGEGGPRVYSNGRRYDFGW